MPTGIYSTGYEEIGYHFMTPEAWDGEGMHRALGYMRPLSIWAMQHAWEKRKLAAALHPSGGV